MRVILLAKSGRVHVLSEYPTVRMHEMVTGQLASGGQVQIPREHVEAIETYNDREIEYSFRPRLHELQAEWERKQGADIGSS